MVNIPTKAILLAVYLLWSLARICLLVTRQDVFISCRWGYMSSLTKSLWCTSLVVCYMVEHPHLHPPAQPKSNNGPTDVSSFSTLPLVSFPGVPKCTWPLPEFLIVELLFLMRCLLPGTSSTLFIAQFNADQSSIVHLVPSLVMQIISQTEVLFQPHKITLRLL